MCGNKFEIIIEISEAKFIRVTNIIKRACTMSFSKSNDCADLHHFYFFKIEQIENTWMRSIHFDKILDRQTLQIFELKFGFASSSPDFAI